MALLQKELKVIANKRGGMHLFDRKLVSSSTKKRIVEMTLIGLLIVFFAIPIICYCLHQPRTFSSRIAHTLLFFFR